MKDKYIGKKYGSLTVIKRVDDYVSPSGIKISRYLCKCDCGNEYVTRGGWLSCGKSKRCPSCTQKKNSEKQTKDLKGKKFGRWTVIEKANTSHNGVYWKCKCDCGNEGIVRGTALTSGTSTSCGCYASEKLRKNHILDLKGLKFGRLTVMYQTDDFISKVNGRHRSRWHCKCDCGNEIDVAGSDLTSGNTSSCGCYKRDITSETHFEDLTGKKIGLLTVVKRVSDYVSPESGRPRPQFLCKCDCGNEKIITKDSLMNGTISCGCINSRGEREISNFLQSKNIKYNIQQSFEGLVGTGGALLHFDFAIKDNSGKITALIEFQGEQHYDPVPFFGGKTKFYKQVSNDKRKRDFCSREGIPLIEISYKDSVPEKLSEYLKTLGIF